MECARFCACHKLFARKLRFQFSTHAIPETMNYWHLSVVLLVLPTLSSAQNFSNPDLEGVVTMSSQVPPGWQRVVFTDLNSLAVNANAATPDLVNISAPVPLQELQQLRFQASAASPGYFRAHLIFKRSGTKALSRKRTDLFRARYTPSGCTRQ